MGAGGQDEAEHLGHGEQRGLRFMWPALQKPRPGSPDVNANEEPWVAALPGALWGRPRCSCVSVTGPDPF